MIYFSATTRIFYLEKLKGSYLSAESWFSNATILSNEEWNS
ncbi:MULTISPECIES: hypothetical protein [Photorhabdus]|nr:MULTISPECIES: hypothetical protein [Photorhabdus]